MLISFDFSFEISGIKAEFSGLVKILNIDVCKDTFSSINDLVILRNLDGEFKVGVEIVG